MLKQNKLELKGPKLIYLQLLEQCNLRCSMCYEWGINGSYHTKKNLKQLNKEIIKNLIKTNKEYKPHYWLYGGEPLLYSDLSEILYEIKDSGCTVEMDTNGTLLKDNALLLINSGVQMVHISLDGSEDVNDSQRGNGVFKKVIEGLNYLYKCKKEMNSDLPKISIGTTITEKNYSYIEYFYRECLDLEKIDHISLELQAYLSSEKSQEYKKFILENFGEKDKGYIDGFVTDCNIFKNINLNILSNQIKIAKQICLENKISFNCYPKKNDYYNYELYFNNKWDLMSGNKKRCVFPWIYTEITANGDVAPCHAFYDLVLGNIHNENLIDIWNGEKYKKFRKECEQKILPNCYACCLYYHNKY